MLTYSLKQKSCQLLNTIFEKTYIKIESYKKLDYALLFRTRIKNLGSGGLNRKNKIARNYAYIVHDA
ncbi:hypothetical protein CH365_02880 [Leptospira neocaledonica]|uniref:Uncharacterized protein n=1 Tax=Leptospira neocaledonica TaxID=2023192 RepID=A0A2N0A244_9LEPT|nr:hypothetical protein CH365_02880 [Leptospira neocaledonica]